MERTGVSDKQWESVNVVLAVCSVVVSAAGWLGLAFFLNEATSWFIGAVMMSVAPTLAVASLALSIARWYRVPPPWAALGLGLGGVALGTTGWVSAFQRVGGEGSLVGPWVAQVALGGAVIGVAALMVALPRLRARFAMGRPMVVLAVGVAFAAGVAVLLMLAAPGAGMALSVASLIAAVTMRRPEPAAVPG